MIFITKAIQGKRQMIGWQKNCLAASVFNFGTVGMGKNRAYFFIFFMTFLSILSRIAAVLRTSRAGNYLFSPLSAKVFKIVVLLCYFCCTFVVEIFFFSKSLSILYIEFLV